MVDTAPTPDLLAAIDALPDGTEGYAPAVPETRPEPTATAAATDAAQATTSPDPAEPTAQQPGESDIDYKARYEEAQRQIANREWSSQGRYLQEKAKREALEARVKQLEEGYTSEDSYRKSLYDQAIAQATDDRERALLARERDAELAQRQRERQDAASKAAQEAAQAEQQAAQQLTMQYHERTMRAEALPELHRQVAELGQRYDLPEEELAPLKAQLQNPAMQQLIQQAPPQILGATVVQLIQHLDTQAREAQARVVARNRQAASDAGTYRGPVNSASAGQQAPTLAQFAGTDNLLGAYEALYGEG